MFTIKFRDMGGLERLKLVENVYVRGLGGDYEGFGWDIGDFEGGYIDWPCTVYVMNEKGATVGKYNLHAPSAGMVKQPATANNEGRT